MKKGDMENMEGKENKGKRKWRNERGVEKIEDGKGTEELITEPYQGPHITTTTCSKASTELSTYGPN